MQLLQFKTILPLFIPADHGLEGPFVFAAVTRVGAAGELCR